MHGPQRQMEGASGGNDAGLLSKILQVEHKLFYFDLKENPRGRYLKISEKTSSTRSTIIVPVDGISWVLDILNYYVSSDDQEIFNKELQLDTKVFYFEVGENRRGRFLKVSEVSVSRNHSSVIIPAGNEEDDGWTAFRNVLAEMNEALSLPNSEHPQDVVGLSDDVGAGFITGQGAQPSPDIKVDHEIADPHQDPVNQSSTSKVIWADKKRFFFDLRSNNRGNFLRISEATGSDRSSIILPISSLRQFHETLGHFLGTARDQSKAIQ